MGEPHIINKVLLCHMVLRAKVEVGKGKEELFILPTPLKDHTKQYYQLKKLAC